MSVYAHSNLSLHGAVGNLGTYEVVHTGFVRYFSAYHMTNTIKREVQGCIDVNTFQYPTLSASSITVHFNGSGFDNVLYFWLLFIS